MGGVQSQVVNETLDSFQSFTTQNITEQSISQAASSADLNEIEFSVCDSFVGINCGVVLKQTIKASQQAKFLATMKNSEQVQSQIVSNVQSFVAQANNMSTGFLAMACSVQDSDTNLSSTITEIINNYDMTQECTALAASLSNLNKGIFLICGYWKCGPQGFDFTQDITSTQTARMMTGITAQALMSNAGFSKYVSSVSQQNTSKQAGLNDLIADLGMFMIAPIVIILAIVFLPGMLKKGGKPGLPGLPGGKSGLPGLPGLPGGKPGGKPGLPG
jgi:hypothetical protein